MECNVVTLGAVILAVAMVERESEVWESDNDFSDLLLLPLKKSIATNDSRKEARIEKHMRWTVVHMCCTHP